MSTPLGSVRIERSGHEHVMVPLARVLITGARYDRAQHRAPYGSLWFTSGTGRQRPQEVDIVLRVEGDGVLAGAAQVARGVVAFMRDASAIETPLVRLVQPKVLSYSAQPAPGGAYRVTVRVSAIHTLPTEPFVVLHGGLAVTFGGEPVTFGAHNTGGSDTSTSSQAGVAEVAAVGGAFTAPGSDMSTSSQAGVAGADETATGADASVSAQWGVATIPGATATADSTTVTADSTGHTADSTA